MANFVFGKRSFNRRPPNATKACDWQFHSPDSMSDETSEVGAVQGGDTRNLTFDLIGTLQIGRYELAGFLRPISWVSGTSAP